MQECDGVPVDVHGVGAFANGSSERLVEIVSRPRLYDLQLQLQGVCGRPGLVKVGPMEWIRRDHQDGHADDGGYSLLEQSQLFPAKSTLHGRLKAGDVSARASKALGKAEANGIANGHEHDGDGGCCRSCRTCRLGSRSHDDIHVELHKIRGKGWKILEFACVPPILDEHILAFHVPEGAQTLAKRLPSGPSAVLRTPIRHTLPRCCASAASGAARRPPVKVPRNARRSTTQSPDPPVPAERAGSSDRGF